MSTLGAHLKSYLKLRQGLGFKMHNAGMFLRNFVRFAETKHACFITTKLALQWASQPRNIQTVQRAYRLGIVRRFAEFVSTVDPRTEVPAPLHFG
jgi:integrase/recombinase XerD